MREARVPLITFVFILLVSGCTAFSFDQRSNTTTQDSSSGTDLAYEQDPSSSLSSPMSTSATRDGIPDPSETEANIQSYEEEQKTLWDQSVVVLINERWVSLNLVTNDQFELCVAAGVCTPPDADGNPGFGNPYFSPYPVTGITLEQAQDYCQWLGGSVLEASTYEEIKNSGPAEEFGLFPKTINDLEHVQVYLLDESGEPKVGSLEYAQDGELPGFGSIQEAVDGSDIGFGCDIPDVENFTPLCEQVATISTTTGDFPPGVCPDVGFDVHGTYCQGGLHYMNIDLINAKEGFYTDPQVPCTSVDPSTEGSELWKVYCTGSEGDTFIVGAYSQCTPPSGWQPNAVCLSDYHYDEKAEMCVYDGSDLAGSGVCPDGYTLAPQANCCAPAKDYPATCPAGTVFSSTWGGCTPYEQTYELFTVSASFEKCDESGGGSGGGSCSLSCAAGCEPNPSCTGCQAISGGACKP